MRVCFGYIPAFLQTDKNGLIGYHAHYWDALFGPLIKDPNSTLFPMPHPATEGCFDYIKQNKTDIGMVGALFPIEGFVDEDLNMVARQGSVFGYDQFLVRSSYNKTAKYRENDIVDVFKVFDLEVLMAILTFLIILFILLSSSMRLVLKRSERVSKKYQMRLLQKLRAQFVTFKVIFGSLLNQHSSYDIQVGRLSPWSLVITSLSLTLFTFLVNTFFTSMINTELVSVEKPVVIRSMEDILSKDNMQAIIADFDMEYNYFNNSPTGSLEKLLSERLLPLRFKEISPDNPVLLSGPVGVMSGKSVIISRHTTEIGIIEAGCRFLYSSTVTSGVGRKMGTSLHPLTKEHLMAYFMSTALEDRTVRTLDSRVTRVRESGLEVGLARETNSKLRKMDGIGDASVESQMECVAGKVVLELPRVVPPAIIYYKSLFVVLMGILGVAGVVWVVERLIRKVFSLVAAIYSRMCDKGQRS